MSSLEIIQKGILLVKVFVKRGIIYNTCYKHSQSFMENANDRFVKNHNKNAVANNKQLWPQQKSVISE